MGQSHRPLTSLLLTSSLLDVASVAHGHYESKRRCLPRNNPCLQPPARRHLANVSILQLSHLWSINPLKTARGAELGGCASPLRSEALHRNGRKSRNVPTAGRPDKKFGCVYLCVAVPLRSRPRFHSRRFWRTTDHRPRSVAIFADGDDQSGQAPYPPGLGFVQKHQRRIAALLVPSVGPNNRAERPIFARWNNHPLTSSQKQMSTPGSIRHRSL